MTLLHDAIALRRHVGAFVPRAPHDIAITGIRRAWGTSRLASDLFDDALVVIDGRGILLLAAATTDPGRPWLRAPMRAAGTAIVVPGHYPLSHRLGLHRGYPALVQAGTLLVWRDATRDDLYDHGPAAEAPPTTGINIHAAADDAVYGVSPRVGRWSAGCQVLQRRSTLRVLVDAVERQARAGMGDRVSYTLVAEEDLIDPLLRAAAGRLLAAAI